MKCTRPGTERRIALRLKAHKTMMDFYLRTCLISREDASKLAFKDVKEKTPEQLQRIIDKYKAQ